MKQHARELVEILLEGKVKKLNKTHFFSFSIAKFILLKEKILIKTGTRKFYFDSSKNSRYIPMIMNFKEEIIKNAEYSINEIEIESDQVLSSELKEALWFFNKIRDSLAHNKYSIDYDNNMININNVGSDYILQCSFSLNLLNSITFIIEKMLSNNEKNIDYKDYLNSYNKYINEMSKLYNFNKDNLLDNNYKNIIYNMYNYNNYKNDDYKNNIYDNKDFMFDNEIYSYIKDIDKIKALLKRINNEKLQSMVLNLLYNPIVSNKELSLIIQELKTIESLKNNSESEEKIKGITLQLIKEISNILGIRNNDAAVALYNYMCLTLLELDDKEDDYAYMCLNKDDYLIIFNEGRNNNYNSTVEAIRKKCDEFDKNIKCQIKSYNEHPSDSFKKALSMLFTKFMKNIIILLEQKNKLLVQPIRNCVEHGNYSLISDGNLLLCDKSNQLNDQTVNFIYVSSVSKTLELTKSIENNNKQNYTFEKFINDLKNIIEDEELIKSLEKDLIELFKIIFGEKFDLNYNVEKVLLKNQM